MATRTTRRTAPPTTPAKAQPGNAERQQAAVAAESAEAMRRGIEAMRQINDRAVQGALARLAAAAQKYKEPQPPLQLLAMQGELLRLQLDGAASYWQELSAAALEMQAELLGCSTHLLETDAVLQTASAIDALPALRCFLHGVDTAADRRAQPLAS